MKTKIFKGRDGWQAESLSDTDANGKCYQINTWKSGKGVKCSAVQGQATTGNGYTSFSYEMFGAKKPTETKKAIILETIEF